MGCYNCPAQIVGHNATEVDRKGNEAGWRVGLMASGKAYYSCPECAGGLLAVKTLGCEEHANLRSRAVKSARERISLEPMSDIDASDGRAVIEDGYLVIRVALMALPQVVEGAWAAGGINTRYKITDAHEFAAALVRELNEESEEGTTRIHKMFDRAIEEAIEQGALGVEEHETQEA